MSHNSQPVLSLRHAGVYYGRSRGIFGEKFWALKDISFDLHHGETLAVIGRNGVGKSTLLRLLAGIIQPDRGQMISRGLRASLIPLQLGFVDYLTGRENIMLSGMLMGLRKKEVKAKMEEIIAFSELGEFIEQPINTYSSGMRARLGFSIAIQADPDILLLDEVFSVGDAEFNQKSTKVMREKIRSDKTVVLVSHNAATIRQLCQRAVWIEEGVSCLEGAASEVLDAYEKATARHLKQPVQTG